MHLKPSLKMRLLKDIGRVGGWRVQEHKFGGSGQENELKVKGLEVEKWGTQKITWKTGTPAAAPLLPGNSLRSWLMDIAGRKILRWRNPWSDPFLCNLLKCLMSLYCWALSVFCVQLRTVPSGRALTLAKVCVLTHSTVGLQAERAVTRKVILVVCTKTGSSVLEKRIRNRTLKLSKADV